MDELVIRVLPDGAVEYIFPDDPVDFLSKVVSSLMYHAYLGSTEVGTDDDALPITGETLGPKEVLQCIRTDLRKKAIQ